MHSPRFQTQGAAQGDFGKVRIQLAATANDLLFGKHLLLRKGKKNYVVITVR